MEVDGILARVLLMASGALSVNVGLGLLFHVVLADAIPNPDTRHTMHTVLVMVAFSGLLYVGFWVM